MRPGARELAHIISASADELVHAVKALEKRKGVAERAVEINRLENEADRVHQAAVRTLFEEERDSDRRSSSGRRSSTSSRRPPTLRGRRQRARRRRRQARLIGWTATCWPSSRLIGVALVFDYINGFHDAANSIATVVSTRVLSPGQAVIWAAFFNFVAAFTFGTAVAKTIGKGMIDLHVVTFAVIFARADRARSSGT